MADETANTEVRYTVKELLADIRVAVGTVDGKIAALDTKLDTKADKADVVALSGRLDRLEKVEATRAVAAKSRSEEFEAQRDFKRWLIGVIAALGGSGIGYIVERVITGH